MKKRIQNPKLTLNKKTIANLNKHQMNGVVGGNGEGNDTVGINNQSPCDEHKSLFKPLDCPALPKHTETCPPKETKDCTN